MSARFLRVLPRRRRVTPPRAEESPHSSDPNALHIGMFTDTYLPQINGVVTSVRGLSQTLRTMGHRVTIVAPSHPQQQLEEETFRLRATTYAPIPEQRMILPPSPRAWTRIARMKFDLIHTHGAFPMVGLVAARMLALPLVHTYHTRMRDYIHYYPWYPYLASLSKEERWYMTPRTSARVRHTLDSRSISIGGRFDAWYANRCEALITPTGVIANELVEMGVRPPIHVIPNGIDLSGLRTPRADPFPALGVGPGPRLLTVGRLAREKSTQVLLERFPAVLAVRPDAWLILLGDGPDRPLLEGLAKDLSISHRTIFAGYVANSEVGAFYQHADVFVFASTTETQGMVALEAAACGLPVVARKEGGIAGSVADGVAGFLVPPDDAQSFVKRILELLEPNVHHMFSASARAWAQGGSLEGMALNVLECYRQATGSFEKEQLERSLYSENLLG
jgi:1,2-diacylglycerol 3-alpha-glucosyltransferase